MILLSSAIVVIRESKDPAKTVVWVLILILFPGLGFLLYIVFGQTVNDDKLFQRKRDDRLKLQDRVINNRVESEKLELRVGSEWKRFMKFLANTSFAPLTSNNITEVLTNGHAKFSALVEALEKAQKYIHMEYYIFRDDSIGGKIKRILIEKRKNGIEVRLLLDGLGCHSLPKKFIEELRTGGVYVEYFFPLKFPYFTSKLNYRNHRKIVVVDGNVAFTGGVNVGDEYLSRDKKMGFWRDTHLRLIGESVHQIEAAFLDDWYFVTGENLFEERYFPIPITKGNNLVQIISSGPDSDWRPALQLFYSLINIAKKKLYIVTPYFIPDASTLMAIEVASMSGVDVRIITQGIPDHKVTYWASRSYFHELLEAGVKIFTYQKGILHSKVVIVDDTLGIVGSANFDIRSFQIDFEISVLVYDKIFLERIVQDFKQDLTDSEMVIIDQYNQRPLNERVKESMAKLLSPVL